ncbi:hypothetical protein M378DRAFT_18768 [Amanita muscaria Koide BX008]|uniref:Uncharacterized protein n=1 Tax=Amanita muscaria (strain Koide BX008) TaxID=946122 RepID=A0A0C2SKX0_AMAMK|nr:hypothetical protein M378DRAFT_18768 [Amanita muscaria Koide BX008]
MTDRQMRWHAELMEYNLQWEWLPELDEEQDEKIMPPLITKDRIIAQLYEEMHDALVIRTILPDLKDEIITSTHDD